MQSVKFVFPSHTVNLTCANDIDSVKVADLPLREKVAPLSSVYNTFLEIPNCFFDIDLQYLFGNSYFIELGI